MMFSFLIFQNLNPSNAKSDLIPVYNEDGNIEFKPQSIISELAAKKFNYPPVQSEFTSHAAIPDPREEPDRKRKKLDETIKFNRPKSIKDFSKVSLVPSEKASIRHLLNKEPNITNSISNNEPFPIQKDSKNFEEFGGSESNFLLLQDIMQEDPFNQQILENFPSVPLDDYQDELQIDYSYFFGDDLDFFS
jgi:hypothetical protein